MSNLLIAESILDYCVPIFEIFGCHLLYDVAAHVKYLLLGTFKENQVFDGLFSTIEKRLRRNYLPFAILHLQPAIFDSFEIFAENELHIHPQGSVEISIIAKEDVAGEFA